MKSFVYITSFLLCVLMNENEAFLSLISKPIHELLKTIQKPTQFSEEKPPDANQTLEVYDFIVVGAGSAGCVVANRLSEISDWNVLLIEAGDEENNSTKIPLCARKLRNTSADWNFTMVLSDNCPSYVKKISPIHQGKMMGGSSSINSMIATRGNRRNYDRWEEMGNPGWGYNDVLPYFLKSENMTVPELADNTKYHSTLGELSISYTPYRSPIANASLQGGEELGYNVIDYNGETQTGFNYVQSTTKNGIRMSSSRAFLHPIKNRNNLRRINNSLVTKILIDQKTNSTFGVQYVRNNWTYEVRARKEVILSAGAINSPKLLMLSGIGPSEHLKDLNIPLIQDLKVGYNLMDHPMFTNLKFNLNQSVPNLADLAEHSSYYEGPCSVPTGFEAVAFIDTRYPHIRDGDPNVELIIHTFNDTGCTDELHNAVCKPTGFDKWTAVAIALQPKSRGRIMLNSTNPQDKPVICHDFFQKPEDLENQVLAIKEALKLSKTQALQKFGSTLNITIPDCNYLEFSSDDYWRCAARQLSTGIWHFSGTCKMSPTSDPDAVVDPRLKVHGVKGLRVIDSSIIPTIPTGHTNLPCIMIGEKGADLVKEDWGSNKCTACQRTMMLRDWTVNNCGEKICRYMGDHYGSHGVPLS